MKPAVLLSASLLASMVFTACSSGSVTVSGVNPQGLQSTFSQNSNQLQAEPAKAIQLEAINKETIEQQAQLRQKKVSVSEADVTTNDEQIKIRQMIAEAESKIADEDRQFAEKNTLTFSTKTAEQGKDIDIELFLYHPKYGAKAKSWGIDNANEFLMAARSPWRRFTLKLKLEGLFAPKGFNQQVLFWAEQADLLRISGVSKDQAWLLVANGITSVPDLARRNPIELGAMMVSMKLMAFQYGMDAPSMSELEDWSDEAKTLEPVLY